jgi:superfamily II DNA or RNA helicase
VSYSNFLASKRIVVHPAGIEDPPPVSERLFPFQRDITHWALRRGRAAIWADCGLGKGWMALEWARVVADETEAPVLILAPLAVAQQFQREGQKLGVKVRVCRDGDDVTDGINVANYERLHKFTPGDFGGVVLDESSCLKDYTSATRNDLIDAFQRTPFRLACSATPAPNDHVS